MRRTVFPLLFMLLASYLSAAGSSWKGRVSRGNRSYKKQNFEKAETSYREALKSREKGEIYYNLGSTLYKQGKFDEAVEHFLKALGLKSKSRGRELKKEYNLGNTYFKADKTKEAVDSWKKALILSPGDKDARHNLEAGLKKLKMEQDKQKEERKEQKQGKKEKQQDEKEKEEQKKEEARRILGMLEEQEKEARRKLKQERQRMDVEKDW